MRVARDKIALKKLAGQDDGYMDAPPAERAAFMRGLTAEIWSLKDADCAQRNLQRDVTNLVRQ